MIRLLLKQIWVQRRSNVWLFLELLIVGVFLWVIVDGAIVDVYTYTRPTGFDASHIYRIKTDMKTPDVSGYVPDEGREQSQSEDLLKLMDQIRQMPEVEFVAASYFSCFYSRGNTTRGLVKNTDTEMDFKKNYHARHVTPEFFDLFRIRSITGEPVNSASFTSGSTILSKELQEIMFEGENAVGKEVKILAYGKELDELNAIRVADVTTSIRNTEYEKASPCFFQCLSDVSLIDWVENSGATRSEIMIRVFPAADKDFVKRFPELIGERGTVNNLYISSIVPITEMREIVLENYWKEEKTRMSLVVFVLLNVLFGIIGTFWLRTNARKSEIGLHLALGADKHTVFAMLFKEGACLLLSTLMPVAVISLNVALADFIDVDRLPFTAYRFIGGIAITYLLMYGMLALGIWYPARNASKVEPAVVLHAE